MVEAWAAAAKKKKEKNRLTGKFKSPLKGIYMDR